MSASFAIAAGAPAAEGEPPAAAGAEEGGEEPAASGSPEELPPHADSPTAAHPTHAARNSARRSIVVTSWPPIPSTLLELLSHRFERSERGRQRPRRSRGPR